VFWGFLVVGVVGVFVLGGGLFFWFCWGLGGGVCVVGLVRKKTLGKKAGVSKGEVKRVIQSGKKEDHRGGGGGTQGGKLWGGKTGIGKDIAWSSHETPNELGLEGLQKGVGLEAEDGPSRQGNFQYKREKWKRDIHLARNLWERALQKEIIFGKWKGGEAESSGLSESHLEGVIGSTGVKANRKGGGDDWPGGQGGGKTQKTYSRWYKEKRGKSRWIRLVRGAYDTKKTGRVRV